MAQARIHPAILCGGGGTRLWPLSTPARPKQFLHLTGERSMLAETAARVSDAERFAPVLAIGARRHEAMLRAELPGARLILEPVGRNSAPAVAAAALAPGDRDALVLALPADHHIADVGAFHRAIATAAGAAQAGDIITFGIAPDHPATGYGYIEAEPGDAPVRAVTRFVEKPDRETAEGYLKTGRYFWNAGIFLFQAGVMLDALNAHAPDILASVREALGEDALLDEAAFTACRSQSIDYAVMEQAGNVAVVPVSMGWSDLGDHRALHALAESEEDCPVLSGPAHAEDARDAFVLSRGPVVAVRDLEDVAVIATRDSVLVSRLSTAANVRSLVDTLSAGPQFQLPGALRERLWARLSEQVLPGWAARAWDNEAGGFVESLDMDGEAQPGLARRGRVAPRQVFSFSVALQAGWNPDGAASELVDKGLAYLDGPARAQQGGWKHRIDPSGRDDERRDFYDHSFVALAGAQAYAATGQVRARAIAEEAFHLIDEAFADETHGGWRDTETDTSGHKRTNPHMHLLEASLAFYAATGASEALRRAEDIALLFEGHMFAPRSGAVREMFNADWSRSDKTDAIPIEPGHCYEWAVLLHQLEGLSGRDTASWRRRMVAFAEKAGVQGGLAADQCNTQAPIAGAGHRLWPQLERVRALLTHPVAGADPVQILERIEDAYLAPGPAWGWVDRLDANAGPASDAVPASMLYHLMTGLAPLRPA
ncbi:MAG: AGE family epimerase/isomerase [Pseudomonadota bacterium]